MERQAREGASANENPGSTDQKQLDALQKSLENSGASPAALEKLANLLQKAQKDLAGLPKDNSPAANAARQQMAQTLADLAQQAAALGQPLPDLDAAIAALKANQLADFQRDLEAATTDLEKLRQTLKTLQHLQQQSEKLGRDLPEQLQFGQPAAARQSLQKMIDQLKSGNLTAGQLQKMLDEVSRGIGPAAPYGKAAQFLKQAAQQMNSGDQPGAAQSLAGASQELEKIISAMADAKALQESLDAVNQAEACLATHRPWDERAGGFCRSIGQRPGGRNGGVGTWTDDDSQLYPEMSKSWDNSGADRPDQAPRGLTDRGAPKLADNLAPTKVHGQIAPGSPMPAITLKGVSIKGQSAVGYQEAVSAAQSDAQSALNQDQVPRAYQNAVRDYFNDLKK
jgi:flagellar biosynthesis chaperone FliJ